LKRTILKVPAGLILEQLTQEQQDAIASVFAQFVLPMPGTIEYEEVTTTESTSQILVWLIDPYDLANYTEDIDYRYELDPITEDNMLVWINNPIDLVNYIENIDYRYDIETITTVISSISYMIVDSITADNFDPSTIPNLLLPFTVLGLWQWDMLSDNLDNLIPLDESFFNFTNSQDIPHNFAGWPNIS
jgi:hypothetical protein